ncbi:hypothetical protein [Halosimplex halobium]|uniref:hypothetical protein n=1 Tax=Halosimplex halobium TaxID=3396618 RepID=UPI003F563640
MTDQMAVRPTAETTSPVATATIPVASMRTTNPAILAPVAGRPRRIGVQRSPRGRSRG